MRMLSKVIDLATIGSDSPVRRLIAYYLVLVGLTIALHYLFPVVDLAFSGERLEELAGAPRLLQDGLNAGQFETPVLELPARLNLAVVTMIVMAGSTLLMLPVTWVYMSAHHRRGYSQSIVQTLIFLPLVVAGIVLIVRNSLALAFSLAGIVAGVRFRNSLRDPRDAVFIFLAIGVGLAAGVQALTVAFFLSMFFSFLVIVIWRTDFGRHILEPRPAAEWADPLAALAESNGASGVPDRDLVLALSPKNAEALADRFTRVRELVRGKNNKPRFNAVLRLTTERIDQVQRRVEPALTQHTKRWLLDEVVTNEGKPSELYYLVRLRKAAPPDELVTAVRTEAGEHILSAEVDLCEDLAKEQKA